MPILQYTNLSDGQFCSNCNYAVDLANTNKVIEEVEKTKREAEQNKKEREDIKIEQKILQQSISNLMRVIIGTESEIRIRMRDDDPETIKALEDLRKAQNEKGSRRRT